MKKSTFLRSLLTLLVMAVWGTSAMAQTAKTASIDFSQQGYANDKAITTVEINNDIKVTFDKGTGSNAPKYFTTGTAVRVYAKGNFIVSAEDGCTITKITLAFGSGDKSNTITADTGNYSAPEWSGSANSVTFTIGGTKDHRRIKSITVEYTSSGATKETQTLAFSDENISINEGETFTAPTLTGAMTTVTYSSSNTSVATVNEATGEVTLVGTGTTIITATAAENENYSSATASYTLTVIKNLENSGTATFDFTDPTSLGLEVPAAGAGIDINNPIISDGVTMTATHGGTATRIWNASGTCGLRFYDGGSITFAVPDGYIITNVSFTGSQNVPADWNGSAQSVTFNATAQVRLNTATITYTQGTIVPKQDQTLTFSGTTFTIEEGESFTVPTLTGAMTTVTYSSSKATVATVDENTGEVTIKGAGTTIITATAAANEEYNSASASYTLTVNPNLAGISLPYMLETKIGDANYGGKNNLPSGATPTGLGSDYGAGATAAPNSRLKFDSAGDNLVFKLADSPATLSYIIKSNSFTGGTFSVETSADGSSYTTLKTYTEDVFNEVGSDVINEIHLPLNADVRYIRWTYTSKVIGNIGLGSIYITKQGDATSMPLSISAAKYATFFSDKAIVMPEGVSGSIVTVDGTQANLSEQYVAGDIVPANTPLMLSAEQGTYDAPFTAATNTQNAENLLQGALTNDVITAPTGSLLYIFANDSESGLGFYWQKNSNNGQQVQNMAGKAYLQVPTTSAVKGFRLNLGETTGITAVESTLGNAPVYTLSGVRVNGNLNNLPAGIYIVGGKKVYVK